MKFTTESGDLDFRLAGEVVEVAVGEGDFEQGYDVVRELKLLLLPKVSTFRP